MISEVFVPGSTMYFALPSGNFPIVNQHNTSTILKKIRLRIAHKYHNMCAKEIIDTAQAMAVLLKVNMPKQATTKALLQAHNISYKPIISLREYL